MALRSMTAYGRASVKTLEGTFTVEIQSVNRKVLEISTQLPKELSIFDLEVRKFLHPHIFRGHVGVKVFVDFEGMSPFTIRPNVTLIKEMKQAFDVLCENLGLLSAASFTDFIKGREDIFIYEENEAGREKYCIALKAALESALIPFLEMKGSEGRELQADIEGRLEKIRSTVKQIEGCVPHSVDKYREKLMSRLSEMFSGNIENEERVLREIALFAEKIDISEEITRFNCHLHHFNELIHGCEPSVGKTLEFILQELNREVNTIGSKSLDLRIAKAVIEIKSELEKIKEQIYNIE